MRVVTPGDEAGIQIAPEESSEKVLPGVDVDAGGGAPLSIADAPRRPKVTEAERPRDCTTIASAAKAWVPRAKGPSGSGIGSEPVVVVDHWESRNAVSCKRDRTLVELPLDARVHHMPLPCPALTGDAILNSNGMVGLRR
jgi:hypothetical protein